MGTLLGGLCGVGAGLCACLLDPSDSLILVVGALLIGAVLGGTLGLFFGESFVEWIKEHFWRFW